jgi:hypothetical protein
MLAEDQLAALDEIAPVPPGAAHVLEREGVRGEGEDRVAPPEQRLREAEDPVEVAAPLDSLRHGKRR